MEDKRKLLHDILDLVIDINGFEQRREAKIPNKPTAFFKFSGHVCDVQVDVHTDGWKPGKSVDIELQEYIDGDKTELQSIIDELRGFKEMM